MDTKLPIISTPLPGPEALKILALDKQYVSPSYTRDYPLVAKRGRGAIVEDVDGNFFLDFAAGIAVVSTGHCHPDVVRAIQKQAETLIHISGTDFYYPLLAQLGEKMAQITPGNFHGSFPQVRSTIVTCGKGSAPGCSAQSRALSTPPSARNVAIWRRLRSA